MRAYVPWSVIALAIELADCTPYPTQPKYLELPLERKSDFTAYLAEFDVGTPFQKQMVKIDTGSPTYSFLDSKNPWCADSSKPCQKYGTFNNKTSSTSRYKGPGFSDLLIDYGSGDFLQDRVRIGGKVLSKGYFGYISFYPFPSHIQNPTTTIAGMSLLFDKSGNNYTSPGAWLLPELKKAQLIDKMAVSFYLGPDVVKDSGAKMIIGGAYDKAKIQGKAFTVPMVDPYDQTLSGGQTNSVNVTKIESLIDGNLTSASYGVKNVGTPVLMDTGSPFFYLPEPIFGQVFKKLGSPKNQNSNGYYVVDCKLRDAKYATSYVTVYFGKAGKIQVPFNRLITDFGNGTCGSFVISQGDQLTRGFGDPFLRSAYTTFDQEDLTITFAQVKYTDSENVVPLA